jgi:hypothetical protein
MNKSNLSFTLENVLIVGGALYFGFFIETFTVALIASLGFTMIVVSFFHWINK